MLAASNCDGTTIITNAACEPEIWDLQSYLRRLGVNVHGAGTSIVTIEGTAPRTSTEHWVIPDRIVAATYLSCAAAAGGEIELRGVCPGHVVTVTDVLMEMGCELKTGKDTIVIKSDRPLKAVRPIITRPYPGFPTDAQPPVMAASLKAEGTTVFVENIFENRFRHVAELQRMGAGRQNGGPRCHCQRCKKTFRRAAYGDRFARGRGACCRGARRGRFNGNIRRYAYRQGI